MNRRPRQAEHYAERHRSETPAALLATIEAAHQTLAQCVYMLPTIGSREGAALAEVDSNHRLLAGANVKRRLVAREVYHRISLYARMANSGVLAELHRRDIETHRSIASYFRRWSLDDIGKDWQLYCSHSSRIDRLLRDLMAGEKELLLPLLRHGGLLSAANW